MAALWLQFAEWGVLAIAGTFWIGIAVAVLFRVAQVEWDQ